MRFLDSQSGPASWDGKRAIFRVGPPPRRVAHLFCSVNVNTRASRLRACAGKEAAQILGAKKRACFHYGPTPRDAARLLCTVSANTGACRLRVCAGKEIAQATSTCAGAAVSGQGLRRGMLRWWGALPCYSLCWCPAVKETHVLPSRGLICTRSSSERAWVGWSARQSAKQAPVPS